MARCLGLVTIGATMFLVTACAEVPPPEDRTLVCRAAIAAAFGRQISIINATEAENHTVNTEYERPDDGTVWRNACQIEGNRVLWASIRDDGSVGRWRNHESDEVITFELEENRVRISVVYSDGSSDTQHYTRSALPTSHTFEWNLITTWPKNLPALGTAPEKLAVLVNEMSAGRLSIKVYGDGELVPAFGVFDAVSAGTAEMGHGAAYYWRGKLPVAALFTTVPFGMTAQEMNAWLHYGGGLELWKELYAPFNLIPMAAGNSGVQMAGWFNHEINSVTDMEGLKMRMPGLGGAVIDGLGAAAVTMPGSEIFTSLQTGVIDATEWVGPYNDLAFGLHEAGTYYYYPGWHEPGAMLEAIVNRDAFDSLPADLQSILVTATRAVNQDTLDEFTARNHAALRTLVEEHDVQLRRLPDDVMQRLREGSEAVLAEVATDDISRRILASYQSFHEGVQAWHAISEQAYINARTASAPAETDESG